MTGAEIVLKWIIQYYKVNGTPNLILIITQLEMAIEKEKKEQEHIKYKIIR